jgi:hypothetical protein
LIQKTYTLIRCPGGVALEVHVLNLLAFDPIDLGDFTQRRVNSGTDLVDILQPARGTGNNFRGPGDMNLANHSTYSMLDMLIIVEPYDSMGRWCNA